MIMFAELSKKRQALILQLLDLYPESKETGTITLKMLKQYVAMVKEGKYVQPHHPMFLYGEKEFRTGNPGVYYIPLPQVGDVLQHFQPKIKNKKVLQQEKNDDRIEFDIDTSILSYDEFEAECKAAGIV